MKTYLYLIIAVLLISCSSKNVKQDVESLQKQESSSDKLSDEEKNIVNDLLDFELKRDRYNSYKNYDYVIIEEALKKQRPIWAYEFSYNSIYESTKNRDYWLLDSIQIQKIKADLKTEKQYYWKATDFKTVKISLLKYETFRKTLKKSEFLDLPKRFIIYLSRPLMIDENNALISFDIGNSLLGFSTITHSTNLMKKKDGKWIKGAHFEDGTY